MFKTEPMLFILFTPESDPLLMFPLSVNGIGLKSPFSFEFPFSTQHQVMVILPPKYILNILSSLPLNE